MSEELSRSFSWSVDIKELPRNWADCGAFGARLHTFYGKRLPKLLKEIENLAEELNKSNKSIQASKVSGSTLSIVGAIIGTVGFGLAFATVGVSFALAIAGGIIGGVGGVTVGGATIFDTVKSSKTRKLTKAKLEKIQKELLKLTVSSKLLEEKFNLVNCRVWKEFWLGLGLGSVKVVTGIGGRIVYTTVSASLRLAKAVDFATDVSSAGVTVFRSLGNVGKGFHIAGGVIGIALIPLDFWTLVSYSINIHKRKPHEVSAQIQKIVEEIRKKLPSEEEINKMVDAAVAFTAGSTNLHSDL